MKLQLIFYLDYNDKKEISVQVYYRHTHTHTMYIQTHTHTMYTPTHIFLGPGFKRLSFFLLKWGFNTGTIGILDQILLCYLGWFYVLSEIYQSPGFSD